MGRNIEIENYEETIKDILESIHQLIKPLKLILFHRKVGNSGKTLSFKVCIVVDIKNKLEAEKNIYKNIDSEIPFDVILYTQDEWDYLETKKHSLVNKILKNGYNFYEQK